MKAKRYVNADAVELAYTVQQRGKLDDTVAHAVQVGDIVGDMDIEAYMPEGAGWALLAVNNAFAIITPAEWSDLYEVCAWGEGNTESPDQERTLNLAEKWVNTKMPELTFFRVHA
jgi:hypothetical protein